MKNGICKNTMKLLGTDIVINAGDKVCYCPATNQPDFKNKELIFVWKLGDSDRSILTTKADII